MNCSVIFIFFFFVLWTKLVDTVSTTTSKMKTIWVWHHNNVMANDFNNFGNWIKLKKTMPTIPIVWNQNILKGYMCNPWLFPVCSNFNWSSFLHIIEPPRENLQQWFLSSRIFLLVFPFSYWLSWYLFCSLLVSGVIIHYKVHPARVFFLYSKICQWQKPSCKETLHCQTIQWVCSEKYQSNITIPMPPLFFSHCRKDLCYTFLFVCFFGALPWHR